MEFIQLTIQKEAEPKAKASSRVLFHWLSGEGAGPTQANEQSVPHPDGPRLCLADFPPGGESLQSLEEQSAWWGNLNKATGWPGWGGDFRTEEPPKRLLNES